MTRYELIPVDGRKSFYGKAVVEVEENGNATLYSYNTPILRKESRDGAAHYVRLWDGWTQTTGRHVWAWARIGKQEFVTMEVKQNGYVDE